MSKWLMVFANMFFCAANSAVFASDIGDVTNGKKAAAMLAFNLFVAITCGACGVTIAFKGMFNEKH